MRFLTTLGYRSQSIAFNQWRYFWNFIDFPEPVLESNTK